jgi:predicted glycosyltransferase
MSFNDVGLISPRIMTYSQDGLGLGHMRRTNSIATQFLRFCPGATVLTLSDSPLGQFFQNSANHDYVKLPSIVKVGPGNWRASNLSLPFADVHELRQQLIRSALLRFRPHIFLVDHMPHGAMGELLPALAALKEANVSTKVVLGLRDILDAPEVVERRWAVEGAFDAIEQYYDRVLIYGMREVFDMAEQYHFLPTIAQRLCYCGYVCSPQATKYSKVLRRKLLNGSEAKLVVAMAGGGADAYPMMRGLLDALPVVLGRQRCRLVLVAGPFMPAEQRADLKRRGHHLPVRIFDSVDDSHSFLEAADVVVAMAGYNTSMEILRSGKPAILIPRRGPSAEQRMRARLFATQQWVEMVDPDELGVDTLVPLLLDCLMREPGRYARQHPDLDGVQETAQQLLTLLPANVGAVGERIPVLA